MLLKLAAAAAVLTLSCATATAEDAKPNDAQIAHIAYTAGQIDIKAAELALRNPRTQRCAASPKTWSATIKRSMIRPWL
jgi:putative membrane protein